MKHLKTESQISGEIERVVDSFIDDIYEYDDDIPSLHIIVVMDSAFMFASDVVRRLWDNRAMDIEMHFLMKNEEPPEEFVKNNHVLVIEDIVDSGETLGILSEKLKSMCPKSISTMVVVNRIGKRDEKWEHTNPSYSCFELSELGWVVGYGMDLKGKHREQPFLCIEEEEVE